MNAQPISLILDQHAEDAAVLFNSCTVLRRAPHVRLRHLLRFENRLAAHLDGLAIGGEAAVQACDSALELPASGAMFCAAVSAIEDQRSERLERLIALAMAVPATQRGLRGAFGWVESGRLRGIVAEMLASADDFRRALAAAACGMHRVDPGITVERRFGDESPFVRARIWRTAGEVGRRELVSTAAAAALADEDLTCQFWAAWTAVLLGDTHAGLEALTDFAATPGQFRTRAFQLTLQAMELDSAHAWLASLPKEVGNLRWLIRGSGFIGDPAYVSWLIGLMGDERATRLAGEAFSLMTGVDLAWLDLERKPPENFESGPNDDPDDPNVDMDEDDGLPWPDVEKIKTWWTANGGRFQSGTRYFMGEPLNRENCVRVLKEGFQRQRIAAAIYLSLLNPGTPLFEWRAPARRQQRLLAQMT